MFGGQNWFIPYIVLWIGIGADIQPQIMPQNTVIRNMFIASSQVKIKLCQADRLIFQIFM